MKISKIIPSCGKLYTFVELLKMCISYKELLSEFEWEFAYEIINKYKKYKFEMMISSKQMTIINQISEKLNSPFYFTSEEFNIIIPTEEKPI